MRSAQQLLKEIREDKDSCFEPAYIRELDDALYEQIDYDEEHKYRVILEVDDYDYVEDEEIIKRLDKLFAE